MTWVTNGCDGVPVSSVLMNFRVARACGKAGGWEIRRELARRDPNELFKSCVKCNELQPHPQHLSATAALPVCR